MPSVFSPQWFTTPDGRSLYALESPERLVEHQQMGTRYMVHVLVVKTYPDRLYIAGLLQGMEAGTLLSLTEEAYRMRLRNMLRLERLGPAAE